MMPSYVALLRAVNLGPVNKAPKAMLIEVAAGLGFVRPRTFLASGNLLFDTSASETEVKEMLATRLAERMGKPVAVLLRDAAEMAAVRDANPFPAAPGNRVIAILLDEPPPGDALDHARHADGEQMALGGREIYVRYTDTGMASSRLVIPAARLGTGRNMNTIGKLADLLA